ncbi:MAG: glycine--tRNA ligase [Oscillospiraceae bacterium]|jgi:glycyl-tRNA synthetase|nr:glycine--tRNA ligase [Oscillospiraceae bacterium]
MEKIVSFAKSRGFILPGSEIYGGLANAWDYGPLGALLKNNIKTCFLKKFVQENEYNVQFDAAILMNPSVWQASGHLKQFSDPLIDCKDCRSRYRVDKLIGEQKNRVEDVEKMSFDEMKRFIKKHNIVCPICCSTNFTSVRKFNLMFKTFQGTTEDSKSEIYLRPETAQGIFVNFSNILRVTRKRIPFGVVQIGKSFRNEITPGNFTFRTREFEQMELEFFCQEQSSKKWFEFYKDFCKNWLLSLGIRPEKIRFRNHSENELSHYSNMATDIEFYFPFGWGELWGISHRGTYDLHVHQKYSKKKLEILGEDSQKKYLPAVIEPSLGLDRVLLSFLISAYSEEKLQKDTRLVLKLHPALSPFKACVMPLSKKLSNEAKKITKVLCKSFFTDYDESGSIGKRYRRQDEIGTPFCITYDFDSEKDNCVTVRDRDTMKQVRINISKLSLFIKNKISF